MEAESSSETSINVYETTRRSIPAESSPSPPPEPEPSHGDSIYLLRVYFIHWLVSAINAWTQENEKAKRGL
jgi:hypothetical protein